jgi:hypothetical protein
MYIYIFIGNGNGKKVGLKNTFKQVAINTDDFPYLCCSGKELGDSKTPVIFFDGNKNSNEKDKAPYYTMGRACSPSTGSDAILDKFQGVNPPISSSFKAVVSGGKSLESDDQIFPTDWTGKIACIKIFASTDYTDDSAYLCTGINGENAFYRLDDVMRSYSSSYAPYWWTDSSNSGTKYNNQPHRWGHSTISNKQGSVYSWIIPKNAKVRFYKAPSKGKSNIKTNCMCFNKRDNQVSCCLGDRDDWVKEEPLDVIQVCNVNESCDAIHV